MRQIEIRASRPYSFFAEPGLLSQAGELIAKAVSSGRRILVVSDKTVYKLYGQEGQPLNRSLQEAGFEVFTCIFPPGENSKNMTTVSGILDVLAEDGFDRNDIIVTLGGGVTGDLAGFAASIYKRGISYVQIPTTLLAACDSSVGGKTGVNTDAGKNMAGTFWQPEFVIFDPDTLETLSEATLLDGLAEIIKAAFIADASILDTISDSLTDAVCKAVTVKKNIVEEDEREAGCRKLLNFGHTIGHAIEKCSGYKVSHGNAVMTGMYLTSLAADSLGWSSEPVSGYIRTVIDAFGYPLQTGFAHEELSAVCLGDKKIYGDTITLAYPETPGRCGLKELPVEELDDFIALGLEKAKS